jgi:hypothetical protein
MIPGAHGALAMGGRNMTAVDAVAAVDAGHSVVVRSTGRGTAVQIDSHPPVCGGPLAVPASAFKQLHVAVQPQFPLLLLLLPTVCLPCCAELQQPNPGETASRCATWTHFCLLLPTCLSSYDCAELQQPNPGEDRMLLSYFTYSFCFCCSCCPTAPVCAAYPCHYQVLDQGPAPNHSSSTFVCRCRCYFLHLCRAAAA